MAADTDCNVTVAPVAGNCTVACGTLNQSVTVAQSGQGTACPILTTYACRPGDGDCPVDENMR